MATQLSEAMLIIENTPNLSSGATISADAVAALRAATHAQHAQLDNSLPLARAKANMADYATHLIVVRDWQLALAPWLSRATTDPSALMLIEQDLHDCGEHLRAVHALPLPDLTLLQQADDGSNAFCWGIAYVVEGSRLGGQVLYRRLREPLAPHPLRYLGNRGKTGMSWPEMLGALREQLEGVDKCQSGCQGAVAAFETLLLRFRQAGCIA